MEPSSKKHMTSNDAPSPVGVEDGSDLQQTGPAAVEAVAGSGGRAQVLDAAALEEVWSPDRETRVTAGLKKVNGAADTYLRGGDWVLNQDGGGCTLSFVIKSGDRLYGLTVGHLANVGGPIFVFAEADTEQSPLPCGEEPGSAGYSYPMFEVGTVVSKSLATDSLIFEIATDESSNCPVAPTRPAVGDTLVGFGAQRRGAIAKVSNPSEVRNGTFSRIGNIAIVHPQDPAKALTDCGDCGTIFVDLHGTPLPQQQQLCVEEPPCGPEIQAAGSEVQATSTETQASGLAYFDTHIVPNPMRPQSNSLAHFNTKVVVPTPERKRAPKRSRALKK
ncbi:unknown protein [Seminavis robusta]|uniref:Uncharacterized protein n=1 Tax=Seminavis robusta TaxID=568900 RepID=A0A9N8HS71_9STRA|nr:unknown protein [Seminavis robusta]|eukprot:Sro1676_g290520.1 n/a (332) ;mRNA; f:21274-22488